MVGKNRETSLKYIFRPRAKGKKYTYYRRGGALIPIAGEFMSYEFLCSYNDIHATFEDPGKAPNKKGTWGKMIEDYKDSPDFKKLAASTKSDYRSYLSILETTYGDLPVALLTIPEVYELRDTFQDTPRKADYLISVLKALLKFGKKRGYRKDNPAEGVEDINVPTPHRPWEDYEIIAFRKYWKPDTTERVAFELALNTGQRGQDVIKMTRSDLKDGKVQVVQLKTSVKLVIKLSQALKDVLDPWLENHDHMMLITNSRGAPFKKRNFENVMRRAYTDAGFDLDTTTHGLRYTAATILKELKLTDEEIASVTGHETMAMVKKYTEQQRRMARAIARLDANQIRTDL
ncbi:MAG: tyrosine-type recombinase/integrase [Proteobacteria bacterium]|nr:tyrosine-type recombinase/integrase [Pseudomonadota bacterium]